MRINEIYEKIMTGPTMLSADAMIATFLAIESVDVKELIRERDIFFKLLDFLAASQSDTTYFEVTQQNKYHFIDFSNWIKGVSIYFPDLNSKGNLNAISDVFLMFPWEIYK